MTVVACPTPLGDALSIGQHLLFVKGVSHLPESPGYILFPVTITNHKVDYFIESMCIVCITV